VKFLIDEQLSFRLVAALAEIFPGTAHVERSGLGGKSDAAVWEHARAGGFAVLTRDEDFLRLSFERGQPPKLVLLRLGNCSTAEVLAAIMRHRDAIERFDVDSAAALELT
jgi:predicted nuclease of predicted toxin-antitoxin system